jgi:hypothetical protein
MSEIVRTHRSRRRAGWQYVLGLLALGMPVTASHAQWATTYEQFYLPARHNWEFRDHYRAADRLFNAFDYGHATLYETLWSRPDAPVAQLEVKEYDFLTRKVLVRPPRLPLEEGALEVAYAKLAPEAKAMFDWAHTFHRQVYDVWADESIPLEEKDARIVELLEYYRSRADLAFSSRPKSMDLMDGQFYSLAFRRKYPKFNGLIWAYHWLQVGLYEPLVVATDATARKRLVDATVGRFRQMLSAPPASMPYLMPMTSGIAPTFARRYPEAGAIFDNLHMMHDVISDILVSREVPRSAKRQEILRTAALFRDDTAFTISYETWLGMGEMMGVNNMGGPAVGFGADLAQPTVERGASMAGMQHGDATQGMAGMTGMQQGQSGSEAQLRAIYERMMSDPVIRERVATDPQLQRMIAALPGGQAAEGMQGMQGMQGMDHGSMPGMSGGAPGGMSVGGMTAGPDTVMSEERRQAIEFVVRLLSDPTVAARVDRDPDLRRLRDDPEVQRRLAELRRAQGRGDTAAPAQPPAGRATPRTTTQPQRPRTTPAPQPRQPAQPAHQHPQP